MNCHESDPYCIQNAVQVGISSDFVCQTTWLQSWIITCFIIILLVSVKVLRNIFT